MLIDGARTDVTAELQEATRDFAAFYERHAYLVYNLALRITCERASAMAAAERSFLEHASKPEDPAALVSSVVTAALANARPRPRAGGAGGPEEEALLACSARALSARERALLAVPALTDGERDAQAGAAYAKLAETRGESVADSEAAYAGWLWAAPPPALWEGLYPKFYRAAERALAASAEDDAALTQKLPRRRKPKRRRSLSGLKFTLALLLPALVIAGAVAWPHLRSQTHEKAAAHSTSLQSAAANPLGSSSSQDQAAIPSALTDTTATAPAQKKRKPLTPQQLDQLRRNELHALQLYSMREEDRRLTQAQRDYAAQKIALLRDLAQRRVEATRRERQLAREQRILARKERRLRHQKGASGNQTLTVVTNDGSGGGSSQPPQKKSSGGAPQNSSQAQQQCLYDANNGTYICQQ